MKLQIDSERCQGHGRCYDIAPGLFGEDDEGYGLIGAVSGGTASQAGMTREEAEKALGGYSSEER